MSHVGINVTEGELKPRIIRF